MSRPLPPPPRPLNINRKNIHGQKHPEYELFWDENRGNGKGS